MNYNFYKPRYVQYIYIYKLFPRTYEFTMYVQTKIFKCIYIIYNMEIYIHTHIYLLYWNSQADIELMYWSREEENSKTATEMERDWMFSFKCLWWLMELQVMHERDGTMKHMLKLRERERERFWLERSIASSSIANVVWVVLIDWQERKCEENQSLKEEKLTSRIQ